MGGTFGEKLKQKVAFMSSFEPTNNERNNKMFAEVEKHQKSIKKTMDNIQTFHKHTSVLIAEAEQTYSQPLPRTYTLDGSKSLPPMEGQEDVLYTKKSAMAKPVERADPALSSKNTGLAKVADIKAQLEDRMAQQVYAPLNTWLSDFSVAKKNMGALDDLRLELDHARRTLAATELKKVKQERNKGQVAESTMAKASTKSTMLDSAKARFREKEQAVFEELSDLVERADVVRDALTTTFGITADVMSALEAVSAPSAARAAGVTPATLATIPTRTRLGASEGAPAGAPSLASETPYALGMAASVPSPSRAPSRAPSKAPSHATQTPLPPGTPAYSEVHTPSAPPMKAETVIVHSRDTTMVGSQYPLQKGHTISPGSPSSDVDETESYLVAPSHKVASSKVTSPSRRGVSMPAY